MPEGNRRSTADPLLLAVAAMVHDLQRIIGPGSEVLIHNLRDPEHSVISIAGNLTGRRIGAPVTDLLLRMLREGKTDTNPVNYQTQTLDGRKSRSSTVFIRDPNGEVIGALCINIDVSGEAEARKWLSRHMAAFTAPEPEEVVDEHFDVSIDTVVDKAVKRAFESVSSAPGSLSKPERLRVVQALDQQGIFLVKKSSFAIANALRISRATLYNDLNQVRGILNSRPEP
jgi:predicted transcriptional regulator YheO